MLGLFKKYNDSKIVITKSSQQALSQLEADELAKTRASICPACGFENPKPIFGFRNGAGESGYHGICKNCGTEWESWV